MMGPHLKLIPEGRDKPVKTTKEINAQGNRKGALGGGKKKFWYIPSDVKKKNERG